MDMELGGLGVGQEHARVVVELGQDDGALHPVVEGVGVAAAADPAEPRLAEPGRAVAELELARPGGQVQQVLAQDPAHEVLLRRGEGGHEDALVRHHAVVAVRAAQVPLVVVVPAPLGHAVVPHPRVHARLALLRRAQALHEF